MNDETADPTDLGSYLEHDGRPAVRFVRRYRRPVERVWAAVTEPAELARWFPSRDTVIEARVGGEASFKDDPYTADFTGTVLIWEPPHRCSFTWGGDELHLIVEPDGEGATLTLIDVLDAQNAAARNGAGWHSCLADLDAALSAEGSSGRHSQSADSAWSDLYHRYVAAGLPSGAPVPD